jgi:hypothetical protein
VEKRNVKMKNEMGGKEEHMKKKKKKKMNENEK